MENINAVLIEDGLSQKERKFYRIYHKSHSTYADYREQVAEWEKTYGENSQRRD